MVNPTVPVSADESNPGNTLLRKLGWREGQGLGRDGEGAVESVAVLEANAQSDMHNTLRNTASGGGSARDNPLATARARYEQVSRQPPNL